MQAIQKLRNGVTPKMTAKYLEGAKCETHSFFSACMKDGVWREPRLRPGFNAHPPRNPGMSSSGPLWAVYDEVDEIIRRVKRLHRIQRMKKDTGTHIWDRVDDVLSTINFMDEQTWPFVGESV